MFCGQCGNNIEDNALFCTKCGMKVNGGESSPTANGYNLPEGSNKAPVDVNQAISNLLKEVVEIVKNPVLAVANLKGKGYGTYGIIGVVGIIISIINVFLLQTAIIEAMGGGIASYYVKQSLENQSFSISITLIVNAVIILAVTTSVLFGVMRLILKNEEFCFFDSMKIVVASYFYSTLVFLIGAILTFIIMPFGIVFIILSGCSYVILLFVALDSYLNERSKTFYVTLVGLVSVILTQILMIYIKS